MYLNKFLITGFFVLILSGLQIITVNGQTGNCNPVSFNLPADYQTSPSSYTFASADFNGDGIADLVIPNPNAQTVGIMYGDGVVGFSPPQYFPTTLSLNVIAVGDLNKDGKPDLIGTSSANQIVTLLNDNTGGLANPAIITVPTNISQFFDLKIGDFNGDGNADAVAVTDQNIDFLLGNGQGGIALNGTINWSGYSSHLTTGDLNGDNVTDIAVTSGETDSNWRIGVIYGRTYNYFTLDKTITLSGMPTGIIAGEYNGDGIPDLIVSAYYPYSNSTPQTYYLQPLLGNSNGNYTFAAQVLFAYRNYGVTAGDFNGDGKLDLATKVLASIGVTYGNGNGTFQAPNYFESPDASAMLSLDANRDGKKDILTLHGDSSNSLVSVLISDGGGFQTPKEKPNSGNLLAAGDLNRDGFKDFIFSYTSDFPTTSQVFVALNDTHGNLLPDTAFNTPKALTDLQVGDFNGDGNQDVLTAHTFNSPSIAVYFGNGTGNLASPLSTPFSQGVLKTIVADFNGDGKDDVFGIDTNNNGFSMLSNGDGTFTRVAGFNYNIAGYFFDIEKGDFNRDGKPDLAITGGSVLNILLGNGTGNFTVSAIQSVNNREIAVGDLNGDGNLDIIGVAGAVNKYYGDGDGGFSAVSSQSFAGSPNSLISGDFNADGLDDIVFSLESDAKNLVIITSTAQSPYASAPVYYTLGGITDTTYNTGSAPIAADYNNDNKLDIGFITRYRMKGIIFNTLSQKPCLSIDDVTVTEGDTGYTTANFTVSLSAPSAQDIRVGYSVEGVQATVGTDLANTSGRLLIPAGQTTAIIPIKIIGDITDEPDENFVVHLSSADNGFLSKPDGIGKIIDNDPEPSLTVSDANYTENSLSLSIVFQVNLSTPSAKPVSFSFATSDGTAAAGQDYYATSGNYTIQAGESSTKVYVTVISDNIYERNETLFLNISNAVNASIADGQGLGTIINDDPIPTLTVYPGSVVEGNSGIKTTSFSILLSNPTYLPVTFSLLTSDGTATAGSDYVASDKPVTIPALQTSAVSSVQIIGDKVKEQNEFFNINVYNLSNAVNPVTQAQFYIINDDTFTYYDFDGDGKSDTSVFRPSNSVWYLNQSTNGFAAFSWGNATDQSVPADYDGDGKTDVAVYRDGNWYIIKSSDGTFIINSFGQAGDIPQPADFDGDGRAELAVYRPQGGLWYTLKISNNQFSAYSFGNETDKPEVGDFDGDGRADYAVYRPSTGAWYLQQTTKGFAAYSFGNATDKPVPADYDGDGKIDIAVYRNGIWYELKSGSGFYAVSFGQTGDLAVPGDYNGDGKTDEAVYRNGQWFILQSGNGSLNVISFGDANDKPVPNAFVR